MCKDDTVLQSMDCLGSSDEIYPALGQPIVTEEVFEDAHDRRPSAFDTIRAHD